MVVRDLLLRKTNIIDKDIFGNKSKYWTNQNILYKTDGYISVFNGSKTNISIILTCSKLLYLQDKRIVRINSLKSRRGRLPANLTHEISVSKIQASQHIQTNIPINMYRSNEQK